MGSGSRAVPIPRGSSETVLDQGAHPAPATVRACLGRQKFDFNLVLPPPQGHIVTFMGRGHFVCVCFFVGSFRHLKITLKFFDNFISAKTISAIVDPSLFMIFITIIFIFIF